MGLGEDLLFAAMAFIVGPLRGRTGIRRLRRQVELHVREVLQQADEEERHLVVRELCR